MIILLYFLTAIDIVVPLKDVSSIEGTKAVLEAKISAQDISSVKWYHNDKLLLPSDRIQMVAKGAKQRLVFTRTHASDGGHYKLVVGKVDTSYRRTSESTPTRWPTPKPPPTSEWRVSAGFLLLHIIYHMLSKCIVVYTLSSLFLSCSGEDQENSQKPDCDGNPGGGVHAGAHPP
uniref:Immunoglobulin I-set domain-containing protein n=1 Tax=Seriola dumerili TaxID=41447 RepID=A0A3B4TE63_SERDU